MSFYATLPSNSSKQDFPKNTMTHFITKLKNKINLDGTYEVAVVQVMFPKNWKYREDAAILLYDFTVSSDKPVAEIKVEFFGYKTLTDLLSRLIQYIKLTTVVFEIEMSVNNIIHMQIPSGCRIIFENGLNEVLGFDNNVFEGADDVIYKSDYKVSNNLNTIYGLYIYTDIAEYQIVGDESAPLLCVTSTSGNTDIIDKIYDSPHYVKVARNNIETIEIDIRSEFGKPIQFKSGQVVIKLHFRKKFSY